MKASQVYSKTMKFVWIKLGLGFSVILGSILLGAILFGISLATGGDTFSAMMLFWLALSAAAYGIVEHYIGYLLKAGHVAAVSNIVTTGTVPDDPFAYGKDKVKAKFLTSGAYFAVDSLITGAVKQLNGGLDIVEQYLGKLPGMSSLISFLKIFVSIALGNVDECCLAYTFYKEDQSAFKSGADGVVIYFQNWKLILKSALKVTVIAFAVSALGWLIIMVVLVAVIGAVGVPGFAAFFIGMVLALLTVMVVKSAFVDSYTMVCMVCTYMEAAPSTEITFDLYNKLCRLSSKFKSLFDRGQTEQPTAQTQTETIA